jgi:hypothetical protein
MTMHQKTNVLIFFLYILKKGNTEEKKIKFDHCLVLSCFVFTSLIFLFLLVFTVINNFVCFDIKTRYVETGLKWLVFLIRPLCLIGKWVGEGQRANIIKDTCLK